MVFIQAIHYVCFKSVNSWHYRQRQQQSISLYRLCYECHVTRLHRSSAPVHAYIFRYTNSPFFFHQSYFAPIRCVKINMAVHGTRLKTTEAFPTHSDRRKLPFQSTPPCPFWRRRRGEEGEEGRRQSPTAPRYLLWIAGLRETEADGREKR